MLLHLLQKHNIKIVDIARDIGVSSSRIGNYVHGKRGIPALLGVEIVRAINEITGESYALEDLYMPKKTEEQESVL